MTIRSYHYQVQAVIVPSAGGDLPVSASSSLGITDSAVFELNTIAIPSSSDLLFNDVAFYSFVPGGLTSASSELGLTDEALLHDQRQAAHPLGLTDSALVHLPIVRKNSFNTASLTDAATFQFGVKNYYVSHDLGLTATAGRVKEYAVSSTLGLTDSAMFARASNNLGLTDSAEWGFGYDASNAFGFTVSTTVNKVLNPEISHVLGLNQAVTYYIESSCARKTHNMFHGLGGTAPSAKKPQYKNTLFLQSFATGEVLQLRNPESDNTRRIAFNRVNRTYFDGSSDIFSGVGDAVEESQLYTITAVKRTDLDFLMDFLSNELGREILLKDWRGVSWRVVVTNPGEVYTEDNEGYWTLNFDVEGVALDGEYAIQQLGLSQELGRNGSIWTRQGVETFVTDTVNVNFNRPRQVSSGSILLDSASFTIV